MTSAQPREPTNVSANVSAFDRFAGAASAAASRAPFFAFCVLLIILWAPSIALLRLDTWQLIINTLTTIITFLLVALLQNSQMRADNALQEKLNAIAAGLADVLDLLTDGSDARLAHHHDELRAAVGLEMREST